MRLRYLAAGGAAFAATSLVAGCSGGSGTSAGATGTTPSASASASVNTSLSGPCQQIDQTVRAIPDRLRSAASSNPTKNVPRAIRAIEQQLQSETANGNSQLKSAVQTYLGQLRQVANSVSRGKMPDLSKLNPTAIDNVCNAGPSASVTFSPPTAGASASGSAGTSP